MDDRSLALPPSPTYHAELIHLPSEILLKICKHLDRKTLLAVSSTCMRLQAIASHSFIKYKQLYLIRYSYVDPLRFDAFQNITKLTMIACGDELISHSLRATLPKLRKLHLSFAKNPRCHQENFNKFSERHRHIVRIKIWNKSKIPFDYTSLALMNDLEELMLDELNDSLMNLTNLQKLNKFTLFVDHFDSIQLYEKFESQLMENRYSDEPFYSMHLSHGEVNLAYRKIFLEKEKKRVPHGLLQRVHNHVL